MADSEPLFTMLEKLIAAAKHATDIRAHLHVELANRMRTQHRVVRQHVADIQLTDVQALCDFRNRRIRHIPDFILRVEQHRNQRRASNRV